MKKITLQKLAFISGAEIPKEAHEKVLEEFHQASDNIVEVLLSAAAIEIIVKTLIRDYFVTGDKEKKRLFQNVVTLSDSFSFRHAKRAIKEILPLIGMN